MSKKHLTDTSVNAGYPICGAPWSDKAPGSLHAVYWNAKRDGRDFCSACMAIMDNVDAEIASPFKVDKNSHGPGTHIYYDHG